MTSRIIEHLLYVMRAEHGADLGLDVSTSPMRCRAMSIPTPA
jgi:hypothetical protein